MPLTNATPTVWRRIALGGLLALMASMVFAGSALAAGPVIASATGQGADATAGNPHNRTESRSLTVTYTTPDPSTTWSLDAGAQTGTGTATTVSVPGPLSLGAHTIAITDSGGTSSYTWRIEPPQYGKLVLNQGSAYGYWPLDDAVGASTALDATTNHFDGDYKNFVVQRQVGAPKCEEQPAAPHQPWACDWAEGAPFDPATASPSNPMTGADDQAPNNGRDAKGYSAYFGGKDDHVQIERMPNPGTPSWTVEAYVKPDFTGETRGIFQHVPSLWATTGVAASTMRFACSGLNDEPNAVYSADIANATWTSKFFHVACTYSAGVYRIYVDGVLSGTSGLTNWSPPTSGAYQGYIGWVDKVGSWWKGWVDDVAYYTTALDANTIDWHYETGAIQDTAYDTTAAGDLAPPSQSRIDNPANNAQYSPDAQSFKAPKADFTCVDVAGPGSGISSCTATVDGNPILAGALLPLTAGAHYVVLTAVDNAGLTYTHTHRYYVQSAGNGFRDLIKCTVSPLTPAFPCTAPEAYFRLDEAANALVMTDSSGKGHNGEYKNDANGTGTGIAGGNNNAARRFFGAGGYAYVNGVNEPGTGYTMELFVKPSSTSDMMLMQHGGSGALSIQGHEVVFRPEERSSTTVTSSGMSIASGSWYYVAATYDGVTAKLYVVKSPAVSPAPAFPGTPVAGVSWTGSTRLVHYQPSGSDTLYLGYGDQLGGNGWLKGDLDEVGYYTSALSSTKLSEHFFADPPSKLGRKAGAKAKKHAKAKTHRHAKRHAKAKRKH